MNARALVNLGRTAARWLFLPAAALIVWGELRPASPREFEVSDKLVHFMAYFGLGALAWTALHHRRLSLWGVIGVIVMGGVLEIVQGMVGRDMSLYDEFANATGAAAGAILAYGVRRLLAGRGLVDGNRTD